MQLQLIPPIHRATHEIAVRLDGLRPEFDITQGEAHVLAHLAEAGSCTVAALHLSFGHKRSTLTGILDRLERRSLIVREIHPQDRRTFLLRPTEQGKRVANRIHSFLAALEEAVLKRVSQRDLEGFLKVISMVAATDD